MGHRRSIPAFARAAWAGDIRRRFLNTPALACSSQSGTRASYSLMAAITYRILQTARVMLELYGHKVTMAYCGPEGVRAAEEWKPDVIIWTLPCLGWTARQLPASYGKTHQPAKTFLIAVTGYGQEADRLRRRAAGFDHHMVNRWTPMHPKGSRLSSPVR